MQKTKKKTKKREGNALLHSLCCAAREHLLLAREWPAMKDQQGKAKKADPLPSRRTRRQGRSFLASTARHPRPYLAFRCIPVSFLINKNIFFICFFFASFFFYLKQKEISFLFLFFLLFSLIYFFSFLPNFKLKFKIRQKNKKNKLGKKRHQEKK